RDGMPWQTLEVNTVERFMLRLFRVYPSVISLLWYLGFKFKINFLTKKAFRNHSFIYCIQVKNNKEGGVDRTSLLDSGRLSYRLWLILQAEDYGVQPYSIASLTAFDVVSGHAPPGTSQQAKMKLTQGMSLLKKTFQTQEGFSPLWMFRSGKFLYGSQAPQTLRVDVHSRLKVYTRYN
ncbi:MAG: hypothetical protein KDD50_14755, partial [Bdellovibrionales bacterium]|nr:hypothetical protein [Bdellovibrionales bacterium]